MQAKLSRGEDGLPVIKQYLLDDGSTVMECSNGEWVGEAIGRTKDRPRNIVMKLY